MRIAGPYGTCQGVQVPGRASAVPSDGDMNIGRICADHPCPYGAHRLARRPGRPGNVSQRSAGARETEEAKASLERLKALVSRLP